MYNLLISLGIGIVVTAVFGFLLGGGSFSVIYGVVPGLLALIVAYIFLARRTYQQLQKYFEKSQEQAENQNIKPAVDILKDAYPLGKWQFLVESQIDGHIGTILFTAKKFDEAKPYLEGSFRKNWMARAMLGVLHYKNKNYDEMEEVFEEAVTANSDKPLLWNVYAYCLWKSKQRAEAIEVLNRALEENPNDEKTEQNRNALQNNSKMKMRGWGQRWYQFHLDRPPRRKASRQHPRFKGRGR